MGIAIGGIPRVPIFSGTAAELAAMTTMITGDLFYTTDTKLWYYYDGAAWGLVATTSITLLNHTTISGAATESYSLTGIASGYKRFIVQINLKTADASQQQSLRLNNDSGANQYVMESILYNGANPTHATSSDTEFMAGCNAVGEASSGFYHGITYDIVNTCATGTKTITAYGSGENFARIYNTCGYWNNTADEISRIDFYATTAGKKWAAGSTITIWGVK